MPLKKFDKIKKFAKTPESLRPEVTHLRSSVNQLVSQCIKCADAIKLLYNTKNDLQQCVKLKYKYSADLKVQKI